MSAPDDDEAPRARALRVAGRLGEFRGEERANLLRAIGIACFYAVQLANRYGVSFGPLEVPALPMSDELHSALTMIAAGWLAASMGVALALRNRFFPPSLKYVVTTADVAFACAALSFADGPRSPLVVILFPLLVLSALRLDRGLVRFATVATLGGYVYLLGLAAWVRTDVGVPRYQQLLMLLALGLSGLVLDATVGASRRLADETADRDHRASGASRGDRDRSGGAS